MHHLLAVSLAFGLLFTGQAFSSDQIAIVPDGQTLPAPAGETPDTQGETPVFRVTVVGRSVPAVNYRPRSGETRLDFAGTALMPDADGRAEISGQRGYMRIEARFDDLEPASRFGPEYLTYVLWAITPEGRPTNLGELQFRGDDRRLTVTTELQAFALVVTAEPYFAVTQPSNLVVLENVVRDSGLERTEGRIEAVEARYELLERGTYLMNQDPRTFTVLPLEPGAPLDLAQARNAVHLARFAGADRYAAETFDKAVRLLAEAEDARARRRRGNEITQPARQAVQTAEDARLIALQRQEQAFAAEQRRLAEQREAAAREAARLEEERRRAEQERRLQAEARQLEAERDRLQAEAARRAAERERAAADAARLAADRERTEAEAARLAADRERAAAEAARLALERQREETERLRLEAEAARAAAEAQAAEAQRFAEQAEREKAQLREQLRTQLNLILETRETARGLILSLSDVLFDVDSAMLKLGARERLARVAGILSAYPSLTIEIEGHTDSTGSDDYNQDLSERRAGSVRAFLTQQGIGSSVIASTVGHGEARPVATNGTIAGRQMNRRVEIVVSGDPIGMNAR